MKLLTTILLITFSFSSCASYISKEQSVYQEDIFDLENKSQSELKQQIKIRQEKLASLTQEINLLNSYNYKVSKRADYELLYNRDNGSISRYLEENNKIINRHKFLVSKLEKEIRVLNRMIVEK